ncbi:probable starch synthase 4, chloroplastic/amyloplastic isoform X1 [Herrania umbratica]|uniref:starch synthase n=2 Tax=Herrania umbratica TaxID=108875 RepID=A0A6J0ZFZ3_9ROSI|nr:probable starch synthase 4, chloroplastic/amyloplastic isoform X1 [Herrania umbratica]
MLMATSISPAIPSSPSRRFSILTTPNAKFVKVPALCCLRKNGEINGLSRTPSPMDSGGQNDGEMSLEQSSNVELEMKNNEIWRLFKEAQQNILYLNKQRLKAVEELNEANREKQLLVDKIEQLEKETRRASGKDNLALCWALLLRIDAMVLGGMISPAEATDLRRMVMDRKVSVANVFSDMLQKRDAELLAELRHFSEGSKKKGFHIIHICTEMEPLVSIGPLAPYITGLSCALQRKGHLVEVILPKYASLDLDEVQGLREIEAESYSYFNGELHGNRIWTGVVYGIGVTFIQPLYFSSFFNRDRIYDYPDDFERFTYFSRASLDYIAKSGKQPDVLHLHNWETAIVGPLFWDIFAKQGLGNTRILLTCHGLDSQCLEEPDKLALCGLDPGRLHRPDRLQDTAKTHLVNILKGGVVYSNKVVVMSSMDSKGRIIRSSHGLEHTLALHKEKLLVAPCGFDNSTWDPSKDNFLPVNYSAENMRGKDACKVALQQQAGLSEHASFILVGCIFSEVSDFELEKLKKVVWNATKGGAQFVFMANGAVPTINRALRSFQEELEDGNVKFFYRYDEVLSHLMFAGSDIILCQSFDDPLLQVPLKALKYGAAPVSITSGDQNFRYSADHDHEITRFSQFMRSTFGNMTLSQALDEINNNPSTWKTKISDAMMRDFSWDAECCDIHVSAYTAVKSL